VYLGMIYIINNTDRALLPVNSDGVLKQSSRHISCV